MIHKPLYSELASSRRNYQKNLELYYQAHPHLEVLDEFILFIGSRKKASEYLQVHINTMYKWVHNDCIPPAQLKKITDYLSKINNPMLGKTKS